MVRELCARVPQGLTIPTLYVFDLSLIAVLLNKLRRPLVCLATVKVF